MAKELLITRGYSHSEFNITDHPSLLAFMNANGLRTVPQIYLNGQLIGGFIELNERLNKNESTQELARTDATNL